MCIYELENNRTQLNEKNTLLYTIKFFHRKVCVSSEVKDFISLHRLALIMYTYTYTPRAQEIRGGLQLSAVHAAKHLYIILCILSTVQRL